MRCWRSGGSSEMMWFRVRPILSSFLLGFQPLEVIGETTVGLCDKSLVEALLTSARLVPGHQQYRCSLRVERKGHSPFAIQGSEPQLLHVGVLRADERIGMRPPEVRAIVGQ